METTIVQIGNSKGIILPSSILKRLKLSLKSPVNIMIEGEKIVIEQHPRAGWAEDAKRLAANGHDALLIPDVFEDETFDDIPWEE
jgi:antitoxin MazE